MIVCLERGADLHMVQLMPLPLTVSCFSKIQIGFTFLVPAHPGTVTVMIVPSSASWSRFSPPSDFVNGHVSAVWFVVCRWPESQEGDWARPLMCELARHRP